MVNAQLGSGNEAEIAQSMKSFSEKVGIWVDKPESGVEGAMRKMRFMDINDKIAEVKAKVKNKGLCSAFFGHDS